MKNKALLMKNTGPVSRRAIIAGASLTTAALALPAMATAAINSGPAHELERLMGAWQRLQDAQVLEGKALDALERELDGNEPQPPSILFEAITMPDNGKLVPDDTKAWTLARLDGHLEHAHASPQVGLHRHDVLFH